MSVSLIDGHIDDDVQMTDEQIIKALEWHSNDEIHCCACPYEEHSVTHYCVDMVIEDALDLINRQKAEIERLNGENKAFGEIIKKQDDEISVLRKDLLKREDLEKSFSKTVKQFDKKLAKTVKLERAEAIKEFVERLDESLCKNIGPSRNLYWKISADIDNLVKEMVGERR